MAQHFGVAEQRYLVVHELFLPGRMQQRWTSANLDPQPGQTVNGVGSHGSRDFA
jgi:hypothetical protein